MHLKDSTQVLWPCYRRPSIPSVDRGLTTTLHLHRGHVFDDSGSFLTLQHGVQVKPLHLCLAACIATLATSSASAGLFTRAAANPSSIFPFTKDVDVIFRAQSDDVPLPPGMQMPIQPPMYSSPAMGIPPAGSTFAQPSMVIPAGGILGNTPQVPIYDDGPQTVSGQYYDSPVGQPQQNPSTWNAFSPPILPDPFAAGGAQQPYAPYGGGYGVSPNPYDIPAGGFSTYGANGPAPYRQGWQNSLEVEWLWGSATAGAGGGNSSQFGVNYDLAYTTPFIPGWLLTWTNEFRLRNWSGPRGGPGLPGKAFRFGWDFELATPKTGPISMKLGVTPSINTDFDGSLGAAAFQLDGRALFIFQMNQYWDLVLGAAYWDRVDDRIIPYAGLVYRDDFWEWRIMYPESTVSLFLGNEALGSKWAYMRAEYHVEAYDVRTAGGGSDQVELEDYRLMFGFRMDGGLSSWFTEAGWVFDRNIDYGLAANGSYTQNTTAMIRTGWSY